MNTNGFMPGDDVLYKMQAETASVLHVLGADGFQLRPLYERDVMQMWHEFCKGHGEACDNPHALHAVRQNMGEPCAGGQSRGCDQTLSREPRGACGVVAWSLTRS